VDQPIAGLVQDLKQRDLLKDTLLVFCTEFGRTPWAQGGKGTASRNHHRSAFSVWLAGGGVKPGTVYGKTDDIGNEVAEDPVHIHDFHATILHIMGFNHEKLTFRYAGRDFRLTDVHGQVVKGVLALNGRTS
jgi:arylsulfatase A-like enzyme